MFEPQQDPSTSPARPTEPGIAPAPAPASARVGAGDGHGRGDGDGDERYLRQRRLPQIGIEGQRRLGRACAVIVGLGATGSVLAPALVRAGVGRVRLIDRDIVERSNLQRQWLYTDADAERARPKAEAAREALALANPAVALEAHACDLTARDAPRLLAGADVVVDGTDNFETRMILNDWCVREGVPWVYTGAVGVSGHTLTIVPGQSACLRCYLPEPPPPGALETCETAGVLGPAVAAIASLAAVEALKLCLGRVDAARRGLLVLDAWTQQARTVGLERDPSCPCCVDRRFDWLESDALQPSERLCGRDAVMVRMPRHAEPLDLAEVAARLSSLEGVSVRASALALALTTPTLEATVFADGRAIVRGTQDAGRARAFCARYLG